MTEMAGTIPTDSSYHHSFDEILERDDIDSAETSGRALLDEYYSRVGEARSIRREIRTLQAVQERLRSLPANNGSEGSVVTQLRDAADRLTKINEEMSSLQNRCLQLGIYETPSHSSESDYIESFSELGLDPSSRNISPSSAHPAVADIRYPRNEHAYSDESLHKHITHTAMMEWKDEVVSGNFDEMNNSTFADRTYDPIHTPKTHNTIHMSAAYGPIHISGGISSMQIDGRCVSGKHSNASQATSDKGPKQIVEMPRIVAPDLLARPEIPPSPFCAIPFRRDPDFVDRSMLLERIRERCSAPASRVALVGLGGVG